jgi:hypothetical protein
MERLEDLHEAIISGALGREAASEKSESSVHIKLQPNLATEEIT